jgi:glycerol-3-phosphate cytidylyltransferase
VPLELPAGTFRPAWAEGRVNPGERWLVPPSTRVLTIGTFDILHHGHIAFLHQCARLGTELYVGVNTDRFVRQFKPAPVMGEEERAHALRQLGYRVMMNDGPGRDLIDSNGPDVLAIGSDWARRDYLAQVDVDQDWLDGRKIILAYVPYVQKMAVSTTEIRRRVLERAGQG